MKNKMPATDAEVEEVLFEDYDSSLAKILLGIYQCNRRMGKTVYVSWVEVLLAHLKTFDPEEEDLARKRLLENA